MQELCGSLTRVLKAMGAPDQGPATAMYEAIYLSFQSCNCLDKKMAVCMLPMECATKCTGLLPLSYTSVQSVTLRSRSIQVGR